MLWSYFYQIKSGFIYIAHFKTIFGRAKVLYMQIINKILLQSQTEDNKLQQQV